MSLENTLLGPCVRCFLQEEKLEAYFQQSRNMLPALYSNSSNLDTLLTTSVTFSSTAFADRKATCNLCKEATGKEVTNLLTCRKLAELVLGEELQHLKS